jgi:DNA-binding LytR/AlgR family response regulator
MKELPEPDLDRNALRCIIVEDEPLAVELLTDYIRQIPFLELTHTCPDAARATDVLRMFPVDVVFLDINLPKMNGWELLENLIRQPRVIVTSAHSEYAVTGFERNVVDYLLKPIEFERFKQASERLLLPRRMDESKAGFPEKDKSPERPFYFFAVQKRSVKIYLDEILYAESMKDAVAIQTTAERYLTHYQLGELESLLPGPAFIRTHRSFLVAQDKINRFSPSEVVVGDKVIPIGRSHKSTVLSRLKS